MWILKKFYVWLDIKQLSGKNHQSSKKILLWEFHRIYNNAM